MKIEKVVAPPMPNGAAILDHSPIYPKYSVEELDNNRGAMVKFHIDPMTLKKLKVRAGPMDLGKYLYENILYRSVVDHVY